MNKITFLVTAIQAYFQI